MYSIKFWNKGEWCLYSIITVLAAVESGDLEGLRC